MNFEVALKGAGAGQRPVGVADVILGQMAQPQLERWWSVRRAQNLKPTTYRCPFCGRHLPALSEHVLIVPEGDPRRRRHAHTACVIAAREAGRLPSREEWLRTQPRPPTLWRRAIGVGGRILGRGE